MWFHSFFIKFMPRKLWHHEPRHHILGFHGQWTVINSSTSRVHLPQQVPLGIKKNVEATHFPLPFLLLLLCLPFYSLTSNIGILRNLLLVTLVFLKLHFLTLMVSVILLHSYLRSVSPN